MTNFDQLFPDNRASGTTTLRQCQLVMLRMLKILDHICTRHNIEYFLLGGTLLGAIRHKGFIPWDDDLDIGMTRDNYNRFLKFGVSELPSDIFFQTVNTDPEYPQNSVVDARLRDKYSSYHHIGRPNNPWHEGLQVDIFVHDQSFLPYEMFVVWTNRILRRLKNQNHRTVVLKMMKALIPFNKVYGSNYQQNPRMGAFITKEELATLIRVPFEDTEVWAPVGYHSFLTRQFGNYMQLPPENKRITNHDVQANPFTPCNHTEILHWSERKTMTTAVAGNS